MNSDICSNFIKYFSFKIYFVLILISSLLLYYLKSQSANRIVEFDLDTSVNQYENEINYDTLYNSTSKRYVAISANLDTISNYYMFNLPFVSLSWRRVGYEPVILLVYSNNVKVNSLINKCIEYLNRFNFKIIKIESPNNYEVLTGMMTRLFVGLLPDFISDNDFIITSDIDLLPINRDYYNVLYTNDLVAWNAYCCGKFNYMNSEYRMYPLSHIGMRKYQWREVMNIDSPNYVLNGEFIISKISETMDKNIYIKPNHLLYKDSTAWYLDQTMISINIDKYLKRSKYKLNAIRYTGKRLDRGIKKKKWLKIIEKKFDSLTDCHSFQSDIFQNWYLLQPLFIKLFNSKIKSILDQYYLEFTQIKKELKL